MSELSDNIRREQEKSERLMIERLYEANEKFDRDVYDIASGNYPPEPREKKWPWYATLAWWLIVAFVLYLIVFGILSL